MKVKIYAVPIYVKLYFLAERQAKVVGKSKVAMLEDAVATLSITLLWIFRLPIRGGICPLKAIMHFPAGKLRGSMV